jgi:glycerol-3-phosphate acyltransferase PlsY
MSPVLIIAAYLLGSFPTAFVLGRLAKGRDIRQIGDRNVGAANAFREMGALTGITVGIIDAAKGAAAVLLAKAAQQELLIVLLAGLAAVIGHNWPVFLGFKGGRGVSTTIGALLVIVTVPVLMLALPAILILIWRRSVTPAAAFFFIGLLALELVLKTEPVVIIYSLALPVLIGVTTLLRTSTVFRRV